MPEHHTAHEHLARLQGGKVLVVGDTMLDAYLLGDAERISPEAPVPVVTIHKEQVYLGGAANVALNIRHLGGQSTLIGLAGIDQAADQLQALLAQEGIGNKLLCLSSRPTTIKTRVMAQRQQMLRLDKEDASPLAPDVLERLIDLVREEARQHPVIVLSDYAKGLVGKAFMDSLAAVLAQIHPRPKLLVDPKPGHIGLFGAADLLTPNAKETGSAANMPVGTPAEVVAAGRHILHSVGCRELLTTLGAQGMALFAADGSVRHIPALAQDVFDVTGAGDTVIATIALGLSVGLELLDACVLANHAAGVVVAKVGAATASPEEIVHSLQNHPVTRITKW